MSAFPTSGLKVLLTATNVDGAGNQLLSHGDQVPSWVNQGDAAIAAFQQSTTRWRPDINIPTEEQDDVDAVSFDGVFNTLSSPGSSASLNFLHQAGTGGGGQAWDLVVAVQRLGGTVSNPRRWFGNETGKGVMLLGDVPGTGQVESAWYVILNNGNATTQLHTSLLPSLGRWSKALVRCDGANLSVSTDFYSFQSVAISGAKGTGNAGDDYSVGGANTTPATVTSPPACGRFGALGLWNRNLALAELLQVRSALASLVGDGV